MQDLISIIVPIYNVEEYLNRCVNSLVSQTYKNIEIILVDDGSPDHCPQICDDWGKKDSRVKVIHKSNGGLSDARNAGISIAKGKYLLFVDSDDYIELDSCEAFIKIADKTDADIIVGNIVHETRNGNEIMAHSNIKEGIVYSNKEFIKLSIKAREWYAPAVISMYKSFVFKENNLKYEKGLLHEDMEMLPKIYFAAKKISYLNKDFYHYIERPGSIMSTEKKEINGKHIMRIYSEWKNMFDKVDDPELQKLLYGFLIKCYLHSIEELKMSTGYEIDGITKKFIIKFGLDAREKMKGILFAFSPKLYSRL